MGPAGMGWMWPFWLLLVVGLVLLATVVVLALSGRVAGGTPPGPPGGRAREVLDERYARGEITAEEYRERRRVLEDGGR